MLHKFPSWIRATFVAGGMLLNTIFWSMPLFLLTGVKFLTPSRAGRASIGRTLARLAQNWIAVNNRLMQWAHPIEWQITGLEGLNPQHWYLVISNHISGLDIPVIQRVFHRHIPFIRFFLKRELIFVPVLGAAWWALDFPFLRRNSQSKAKKPGAPHDQPARDLSTTAQPAARNADRESAERTFERTGSSPSAILTFAEGTRFTQAKHDAQNSPYRNLLLPKSGGIAYALEAMGERFAAALDVTLYYPDGMVSLWDMFAGKVSKIIVHVEQRKIPEALLYGDYQNDATYRDALKAWVHTLWLEKDDLLDRLHVENLASIPAPIPAETN